MFSKKTKKKFSHILRIFFSISAPFGAKIATSHHDISSLQNPSLAYSTPNMANRTSNYCREYTCTQHYYREFTMKFQ